LDLKRREGENFLDWKYRILESKLNKEVDIDWSELVELLGLESSGDHLRKTAYGSIEAKKHYEQKLIDSVQDSHEEILLEIEEKKRELFKERVKLQDARRQNRYLDRVEARVEVLIEEMLLEAKKLEPLFVGEQPKNIVTNKTREALALWSDWHYGQDTENHLNVYNREIAKERIKKLVYETIEYSKEKGINKIHIGQLGDIVNGQIHISTRVNNEIEVGLQIMQVSEILAEAIAEIAREFEEVVLYSVVGNHGRTINKKEDAHIKDNFEYFIVWWLKERLRDFNNITYVQDKDGVIITEILGSKIALAHGNYERLGNPQVLNDTYGTIFNYIIVGHYHHTFMKEISKFTDFIVNNSLCGTDEYALTIRKGSKPAQKLLIFDEDGLETIHNIRFLESIEQWANN